MRQKLAGLLTAIFLLTTFPVQALSEEEPIEPLNPAPIPVWAYETLADAYALGLWEDGFTYTHMEPVTEEVLAGLCTIVGDKLELLNAHGGKGSWPEKPFDGTRGGVLNALYREAAGLIPQDTGAYDYLAQIGVVRGDETGLSLERTCTLMEAVVLSTRLILGLYDQANAGSLGLLWVATNGENTLYLLGTAHVDRDNIYPFHRQLREVIACADEVIFEVNFNDTQDTAAYALMQMYAEDDSLKNHVSDEVYEKAVEAGALLGLTEDQVALYKPWALGLTFQALSLQDETTGSSAMAVDLYVNAAAVNQGIQVGAVESYVYQGGLFDSLSEEYQEDLLWSGILLFLQEEEAGDLVQAADNQMTATVSAWKERDFDAFSALYDKEAILNSGDELNTMLFAERDPNMVSAAAGYLQDGTGNTYLLVVGAGHMVGETGIIQGLRDLGYTVEPIPVP